MSAYLCLNPTGSLIAYHVVLSPVYLVVSLLAHLLVLLVVASSMLLMIPAASKGTLAVQLHQQLVQSLR